MERILKGSDVKEGTKIAFVGIVKYRNPRMDGIITKVIDQDYMDGKAVLFEITFSKKHMPNGNVVGINQVSKQWVSKMKPKESYLIID